MDNLFARFSRLGGSSFVRYFAASFAGLVLDFSAATVFHTIFGWSLVISATVSLALAAAVMYFVHEFWTFRGARKASFQRLMQTLAAAFTAFATRAVVLSVSGAVLGDRYPLLQLSTSVAISFGVNYILLKMIIVRRGVGEAE